MSIDYRLEMASLVGEIMALTQMINEFTEFCVMVRFSGHVKLVEVSVRESKQNYSQVVVESQLYLDSESGPIRLKRIRTELRKILRKNEIDYGRLNFEIEEVRHYKLH